MNSLNKGGGVHSENLRIFTNCVSNKMDYRQKHEDDDDEDLETLRLAALKSLRGKQNIRNTRQPALLPRQFKTGVGYPACQVYNSQRPTKRGYYQNRPSRQNGNTYYPSRVNRNLIEIVPMEEENTPENDTPRTNLKIMKSNLQENANTRGESKFYRYKENQSGSDEDDPKEANSTSTEALTTITGTHSERGDGGDESGTEKDNRSGVDESPRANTSNEDVPELAVEEEEGEEEADEEDDEEEEEEEEEEDEENEEEENPPNDDDDDVLLMADLEEEDSLERLMDEMEREMNVDKEYIKIAGKVTKKDAKESKRINDVPKVRNLKSRSERACDKNGIASGAISSSSLSLLSSSKNERRSVSPRSVDKVSQKRRSLSPKPRPRKKSPRRSSPRRSPARISKKTFREIPRLRSSPTRFSPRPRSPRLSPRRSSPPSNNRSPQPRRSPPLRKLSPRPISPRSRSPRIRRSRSPRVISRLRSPKRSNRSRSPRIVRSRSPRVSPMRMSPRAKSPRSKSPRISPARRTSPIRRISPRPPRSPRLSPRRVTPNRQRSPKLSSSDRRRGSPIRLGSPVRLSPHRSPWSSPRNSPRLSPRRRKSPKESTRKTRQRSSTPDSTPSANYKREASPLRKTTVSPVTVSSKGKQKETSATIAGPKDSNDAINDPVLEARRRKFESTKPIDPVNDNKKIKLSKKDNTSKKRIEMTEEDVVEHIVDSPKARKSSNKVIEEYDDLPESDLCLTDDYVYEVLEEVASDDASSVNNTVAMCVEMVPVKVEKERSKKKKKRDKELYQVGKLKGELPLSERICKEKKCKKRKERVASPVESLPEQRSPTIEDHNVDEEEADLRTELSRRRAERLNRAAPIQSARLLQSAFKGVVNEVAKTNAKVQIQRHAAKGDEKNNKKEVRRVTVLHRTVADLPNSEDEAIVDSKVPIRFRLGINKSSQESREPKTIRKSSKRSGRKVKHKNNMALTDQERKN